MDEHLSQRADSSAAEVPGSAADLRVMDLMVDALKKSLLQALDTRFGALDARFVALETRLDDRLRQLGERMEDLEDRDRYARHASRFVGVAPRTVEEYRTSASSINAGRGDVDIFPSLSQ